MRTRSFIWFCRTSAFRPWLVYLLSQRLCRFDVRKGCTFPARGPISSAKGYALSGPRAGGGASGINKEASRKGGAFPHITAAKPRKDGACGSGEYAEENTGTADRGRESAST